MHEEPKWLHPRLTGSARRTSCARKTGPRYKLAAFVLGVLPYGIASQCIPLQCNRRCLGDGSRDFGVDQAGSPRSVLPRLGLRGPQRKGHADRTSRRRHHLLRPLRRRRRRHAAVQAQRSRRVRLGDGKTSRPLPPEPPQPPRSPRRPGLLCGLLSPYRVRPGRWTLRGFGGRLGGVSGLWRRFQLWGQTLD